jgi:hypothetical protein
MKPRAAAGLAIAAAETRHFVKMTRCRDESPVTRRVMGRAIA